MGEIRPHVDEASWLAYVTDYATRVARPPWRRYHTLNSVGSDSGFPDLVLLRPPRLLFVELKTDRGRVTPGQWLWLDDLGALPPDVVEVYVWRPSDREAVERILK